MRILFLTNFYPPASRGGYEQWCQEVGDGLRARGHDVLILTSAHGRDTLPSPDPLWVRRELRLEMEFASLKNAVWFFTRRKQRERENLALLRETVKAWAPETILVWGMWNFPRSLPALAESLMPEQTVYYMGDYWPTLPSQYENYWNASPRSFFTGLPKLLLKPIARGVLSREEKPRLLLRRVLFPSDFMRKEFKQAGIPSTEGRVVFGAVDTTPYLEGKQLPKTSDVVSLLYVGRLTHEKGAHTAIEAVSQLVKKNGIKHLKLTIVGDGEADYLDSLHKTVERDSLSSFVTFLPAQPKESLPALYRQSDLFLFTSIWQEPFGRVIVEAMASGMAVVGTAVGGAAEILVHDENALVFEVGDSFSLAQALRRLIESPALREKLGSAGRETARSKFDLQRMTDEIERYLRALIN
ncbi:MAG TPA: glycosyltransferase family 4 protein [Anaerolineales bacterium]|nr:glycosyltransferase family 4 protein [Anaerolineales bacterium]HQX15257.1 glycosyltransferase family 4 protein [Anaerolineales bacterium]